MTLIARVVTRNGTAIQGQFGKIDTKLIFRPGDPLERTVRIPILKPIPEGGTFDLIMPDSMRGGGLLKGVGHCVCKTGAVPIAEIPWTGRAAKDICADRNASVRPRYSEHGVEGRRRACAVEHRFASRANATGQRGNRPLP
jgi:hypothetical protein